MIIKVQTRALSATDTEGERIAVTFSTGETGTFPYPYKEGLDGVDAHEECIKKLVTPELFDKIESFYKTGETERGYHFAIMTKDH